MSRDDPHADGPVLTAGADVGEATAAALLLHGRGAGARDILALGRELAVPGLALLAPEAAGRTWYPQGFMAPIEANEPWLSSAVARVGGLVEELARRGLAPERLLLVGFSQGACLALESAVRHPRRLGGVVAFTGGLIGPPGTSWPRRGSLGVTPALLAAGDPDPHVPWSRVEESAAVLEELGAEVDLRRYPGIGHTVVGEEIEAARRLVERAVRATG